LGFLIRHVEKLVLGTVLVALLGCVVFLYGGLQASKEHVSSVKRVAADIDNTNELQERRAEEFTGARLLVNSDIGWSVGDTEKGTALFVPPKFLLCSNHDCAYVVKVGQEICHHCGRRQGVTEDPKKKIDLDEVELDAKGDTDGDGIPNAVENLVPFLDARVASDALRDEDQDWFSNLQEYTAQTAMDDPKSHPPLVHKLRVLGFQRKSLPIFFSKLIRHNPEDKSTWDIFMRYKTTGGRDKTGIFRVGDDVLDYHINDIEYREKTVFDQSIKADKIINMSKLTLQKEGQEPLDLVLGQKTHEQGVFVHFLYLTHPTDPRRCRRVVASLDEPVVLPDRAGQRESYKIAEVGYKEYAAVLKPVDGPEDAEGFLVLRFNRMVDMPTPTTEPGMDYDEEGNMEGENYEMYEGEGGGSVGPGAGSAYRRPGTGTRTRRY